MNWLVKLILHQSLKDGIYIVECPLFKGCRSYVGAVKQYFLTDFTGTILTNKVLTEACAGLSQNPERGHVPSELNELAAWPCRQIVIKNYRIIYQVIGKVVIIHGIIDGHRNIREIMRQRILL